MEHENIYLEKVLKKIESSTIDILKEQNMLRPFIKRIIISQLTKDIILSEIDINKEIEYFYSKKNFFDDNRLEEYLNHNGITKNDLHHQILLPHKIYKFSKQNFEKNLDQHFLKRKESLDKYTYNVLRVNDVNLAYELYFQLESGESNFAKLSLEYSLDNNIFSKGIAGPTNLDGTHQIIEELLKKASPGILVEPFKVEKWWLIIKLIKRNQASLDFETTKTMLFELFDNFIEKKVNNVIEENISKTIFV
tara:strand:- start:3370 stop:4119 length:750 start_codon:yes stop_codon:yes gene_type:complete